MQPAAPRVGSTTIGRPVGLYDNDLPTGFVVFLLAHGTGNSSTAARQESQIALGESKFVANFIFSSRDEG